jgi:16S rRNA (cytidine1402-2'-O)-methyltransferase
LIACEDTRQTVKLLRHFGIAQKPLISYHNFNERAAAEQILCEIQREKSVALVTDAGTPAISDPGFFLVREAYRREIKVVPIGGISALTAAVSICPIPIRYFHFEGFLPQKKGRQTRLKTLARLDAAVVLYESPHRILKLLDEIEVYFGNPTVMIARELTKVFEEILVGSLSEMKAKLSSKKLLGEFVVIVGEGDLPQESLFEDESENENEYD